MSPPTVTAKVDFISPLGVFLSIPTIHLAIDPLDVHLRMDRIQLGMDPIEIRLTRIPDIRMHLPADFSVGLTVLGMELMGVRLCGEAQVITEPYLPNPCEVCGPLDVGHLRMDGELTHALSSGVEAAA